jgi:transglutaminase-like putative cysteine protease
MVMNEDPQDSGAALRPTATIDSDHQSVKRFAETAVEGCSSDHERAVKLYYAVRDGFRYDPYKIDLSVAGLSASRVLANGYGWCVTKAVLLAAACRAVGVPARVGFADVRNHLSTARLREAMGTDVFYYHGYTAIRLGGEWLKATPAFNVELCQKFKLHTLEFDGSSDSIYHPYDLAGRQHMEYVNFRGEYDEVPRESLLQGFAEHYPNLPRLDSAGWEADVKLETAG